MKKKYIFKLYLSLQTPKSRRLIRDLIEIFNRNLQDQYSLKVIDVTENPELGFQADIICTPTLIKEQPEPYSKCIIGYFTDEKSLLSGLKL